MARSSAFKVLAQRIDSGDLESDNRLSYSRGDIGRFGADGKCRHGQTMTRACEACDAEEFQRRVQVSFGAGLYRARSTAGITQLELADRINMSRSAVSAMEAGRQDVTLGMMHRLAKALGCDRLDLWPK